MNKEDLAEFGGSVRTKYPENPDLDAEERYRHLQKQDAPEPSFEIILGHRTKAKPSFDQPKGASVLARQ